MAAQVDEADPAYDVFELLGAGERWSGDLHLAHRAGGFLRLRVRGRPLVSASGGQVGVMLVAVPADEAANGYLPPLENDHEVVTIGRRITVRGSFMGRTPPRSARARPGSPAPGRTRGCRGRSAR